MYPASMFVTSFYPGKLPTAVHAWLRLVPDDFRGVSCSDSERAAWEADASRKYNETVRILAFKGGVAPVADYYSVASVFRFLLRATWLLV
jgi:hypothetical protein